MTADDLIAAGWERQQGIWSADLPVPEMWRHPAFMNQAFTFHGARAATEQGLPLVTPFQAACHEMRKRNKQQLEDDFVREIHEIIGASQ